MNEIDSALFQVPRRPLSPPRAPLPAIMTHVVVGYPSLDESIDIVKAMVDGGARFVELQIPFSDPMADGPTIMAANEASLAAGTKVEHCFRAVEKLRAEVQVPLLFMSYFNILFRYGRTGAKPELAVRRFCKDAAAAGVSGLIVPDVPPEENSEGYWSASQECGLIPIPIVSPVSTSERLDLLREVVPTGFVYCTSTTGTTGARGDLPSGLGFYLKRVRGHFKRPLAVGFGISTPEQVRALGRYAEIAVVGSATIDLITKTDKRFRAREVKKFVSSLAGS